MEEIVKITMPALVGAIGAYVGTAIKNFMDVRSGIDKDLREVRIKLYKLLWQKTK